MEGGATVVYRLVMQGGVQFQSRWIAEMFRRAPAAATQPAWSSLGIDQKDISRSCE
jgi:hypothetical protein